MLRTDHQEVEKPEGQSLILVSLKEHPSHFQAALSSPAEQTSVLPRKPLVKRTARYTQVIEGEDKTTSAQLTFHLLLFLPLMPRK